MTQPGAPLIAVRPAVFQDLNALLAIDTCCFPLGIAYPRDEIAALLHSTAVTTLVAERSQEILGFASIGPVWPRRSSPSQFRGELITIDVLPEYRRERVGWRLHEALANRLLALGCRIIELHVAVNNDAAIAFYKRLNYRVLRRVPRYYLNRFDAWLMEKSLSD